MVAPVRTRRLITGVFVACVLTAVALLTLGPAARAASAARGAETQSVLVVRAAAGHDALWTLSSADGTATAAGDLPGRAGVVAVAPDGANVAYLPADRRPHVWIAFGPLGVKDISLAPLRVKSVDSLTWVDDHRLLVSGTVSRTSGIYGDRLYLVNAATGKASWFRKLRGTEPYAVPALGKVIYARLRVLDPGGGTDTMMRPPTIRETLRVVKLSGGTGTTVKRADYKLFADHRAFARPQLSVDGDWLLSAQTGSDISVIYSVSEDFGYPLFSVFTASLDVAAGWTASGRTAFTGSRWGEDMEAFIWTCDPYSQTIDRTPPGLLPNVMVTDLAWSADDSLVAGAIDSGGTVNKRHTYVLPADLSTARDLGTGRLPVWVALP